MITIYGFRNLKELEAYSNDLQTKFNKILEVKDIYIFSSGNMLKNSPDHLLITALEEYGKETSFKPLPVEKVMKAIE